MKRVAFLSWHLPILLKSSPVSVPTLSENLKISSFIVVDQLLASFLHPLNALLPGGDAVRGAYRGVRANSLSRGARIDL